ncbi:MAG TPA: thioredoxin domain-containing protein [Pseudonocardia sp.]|jgi:protein-disulfide isomerase|nr:thioredoxin domain-containing protein [Pseudonocardia sp.]
MDQRLSAVMVADEAEQTQNSRRGVWIGIAVAIVVVAALAAVSIVGGRGAAPQAQGPDQDSSATAIQQARLSAARRIPGDPLAMGRPDAPVVLVEWADFQCPYCAAFTKDTLPTLINQYVKTGKARLEWRDFAFLGKESTSAAIAARAAARQGKFWPYHDQLYTEQHPENSGAVTPAYLVDLAKRLGLDTNRFQSDLADPALAKQVAGDESAGSAVGVTGTPTVLVNGQLISGAEELATYQRAIDAALAPPAKSK